VLNRIRSVRGGKLNDSNFVTRMRGEGEFADQMKQMFDIGKRKAGLNGPFPKMRTDLFRVPGGPQMSLF
jgi:hypothetical protein